MRHLYDEVLRRFPEITPRIHEGDEDLPYVYVGYIVNWLRSVAAPTIPPAVIHRVVQFDRWCMQQPRGENAGHDILTIEAVALREKLFEYDELLPLVPHICSRSELLAARDYLVAHVGEPRFEAAMRTFKASRA